jgi:hypothetical protein
MNMGIRKTETKERTKDRKGERRIKNEASKKRERIIRKDLREWAEKGHLLAYPHE